MRYLLALLLLSACGATGQTYSHQLIPEPKDQSTLIVYRPSHFVGSNRSPWIMINGVETCDLANGSFMAINVNPGPVTISAQHWDLPGTSRLTVNAERGRTEYVRFNYNESKFWGGVAGGQIGILTQEATSSTKGPFLITEVSKNVAEQDLLQTKQAITCK